MRRWLLPAFLGVVIAAAAGAGSRVSRASLSAMELSFNKRVQTITMGADAPVELLGWTRGVYLDGYGAVFTAEVNLSQSTDVSPFQLTIPKEWATKLHVRKQERVPILKKSMQEAMLAMAASLDAVRPNERIVLGVTLFYRKWEDTSGLPGQILMQAERQKLLDVQIGRANKSALDSIIQVEEL